VEHIARKLSRVNWKNINKKPNPAKQEKAQQKRDRKNEKRLDDSVRARYNRQFPLYPVPLFREIWIYGMPSVRQDFKK
jgi:hypothetical protein